MDSGLIAPPPPAWTRRMWWAPGAGATGANRIFGFWLRRGRPLMRFAVGIGVILLWHTTLTTPLMRFAVGIGVILLWHTALTTSYTPGKTAV